jgi:hypothetical protein
MNPTKMIETVSIFRLIEAASKQLGKYIVYVNNPFYLEEHPIYKRLCEIREKYSTDKNQVVPLFDNYFIFDSEEKAWEFYREFECPILGDSRVFAYICSPTQGGLTENT